MLAQDPGAETPERAPAGLRLTLEEAVEVARRNNPAFQSRRNDLDPAEWAVREAYASFLPRLDASLGMNYTGSGIQRIGTLDFGSTPERYFSRYGLTASYQLDGSDFFRTSSARAERDATRAGIEAAAFELESAVTLRYMTALRARESVEVARGQLHRARQSLQLVETRVEAGAAAAIEARQAEVEAGRSEAALIRAERTLRAEKLRLMEQIGVVRPEGITLVSEVEIFEPAWSLEELLTEALDQHPGLAARRGSERAGRASVRQARSRYFPSVSLSASLSGSALETGDEEFLIQNERNRLRSRRESCEIFDRISSELSEPLPGFPQDCSDLVLTPELERRILEENDVFPFDFTENPLSVSFSVSLPLFTGFDRQRQVAETRAALRDRTEERRAEELRIRTAVTRAYDDLDTAHRLVQVEGRNRDVAAEQLSLARQRYALGAADVLALMEAQTSMATAEQAYLSAVYDFHTALASLEAAVGRSLRPPSLPSGS